ncbi:MAG: bifunctional demethylmenaquinone methyltransferase/2-methoxy-6-polyprenyl-1,4-benzoquinol methylase UbiE, partial [Proteobacteria bacterium]|nr:bifunctional demethylmenaquinone methyltransferase/2-methoxy-6-polyprenyl-1,4-benzoquinol methylase UbiE [Pseudomonadota bacterium]
MAERQKDRPGTPETTHFGFRRVDSGEKAGLVRAVFDSVA